MTFRVIGLLACLALPLLTACAGGGGGRAQFRPVSDTPVKVGKPYTVRGQMFVPAEDPRFDMLGYASWYGHESGSTTANGERFDARWITGAHTTLPLPSYVEVTALDTGRTILVRINDRGPFRRDRLIDLSKGAAEQLGMLRQGSVAVRVRRVDPPERDREKLRRGEAAAERPRVPERMLVRLRAQVARAPAAGR